MLFYYGIARRLPVSYSRYGGPMWKKLRRVCAQNLLAHCGVDTNIEHGAHFDFGDNVWLGNKSDLGVNCEIHGEVHIGDCTFMGPGVGIWTSNHRFDRHDIPIMDQGSYEEQPVYIGSDVWVGARVIILPGVHIGDHSIIGAASVVTKDIPPWSIAVGNPARVIRSRCA